MPILDDPRFLRYETVSEKDISELNGILTNTHLLVQICSANAELQRLRSCQILNPSVVHAHL